LPGPQAKMPVEPKVGHMRVFQPRPHLGRNVCVCPGSSFGIVTLTSCSCSPKTLSEQALKFRNFLQFTIALKEFLLMSFFNQTKIFSGLEYSPFR